MALGDGPHQLPGKGATTRKAIREEAGDLVLVQLRAKQLVPQSVSR